MIRYFSTDNIEVSIDGISTYLPAIYQITPSYTCRYVSDYLYVMVDVTDAQAYQILALPNTTEITATTYRG